MLESASGSGVTQVPAVSVIIPTLNSEKTLMDCLESITMQDYPEDKIEVIVADGGSIDSTIELVSSLDGKSTIRFKIVSNKLKTGEAGKAVGF